MRLEDEPGAKGVRDPIPFNTSKVRLEAYLNVPKIDRERKCRRVPEGIRRCGRRRPSVMQNPREGDEIA